MQERSGARAPRANAVTRHSFWKSRSFGGQPDASCLIARRNSKAKGPHVVAGLWCGAMRLKSVPAGVPEARLDDG